jgi:hypothetical protein
MSGLSAMRFHVWVVCDALPAHVQPFWSQRLDDGNTEVGQLLEVSICTGTLA